MKHSFVFSLSETSMVFHVAANVPLGVCLKAQRENGYYCSEYFLFHVIHIMLQGRPVAATGKH